MMLMLLIFLAKSARTFNNSSFSNHLIKRSNLNLRKEPFINKRILECFSNNDDDNFKHHDRNEIFFRSPVKKTRRIFLSTVKKKPLGLIFTSYLLQNAAYNKLLHDDILSLADTLDGAGPDDRTSTSITYSEPSECQNGSLMAEGAIPGAYQQVCMTLPKRTIILRSTGDHIAINQGTSKQTDSSHDVKNEKTVAGRTGVALWNSALLLSRLLELLYMKIPNFFTNKTVLELGCGTALGSIVASKLGAKFVIATDGNTEVLNLARKNFRENGVENGKVASLQWGFLDAYDFFNTADIVIGSDLTYNSGSWGVLSETLDAILKPYSIMIYLTLGHSGFNVGAELTGFLSVIENIKQLEIFSWDESCTFDDNWPFGENVHSLDTLLNDSLTSEEKDIIRDTGGFRIIVLRKKGKA